MGSWNNTCALTNLPICYGDMVYIFPLKEVDPSGHRSRCYSTSMYSPTTVPFTGKYDDYGQATDEAGISFERSLDAIKQDLVEMEVGENKYHDIAVKREEFGPDLFYEAIHEDRLFVKSYSKTPRPVYFAMVRKDIADRLWNEWEIEFYGEPGEFDIPVDRQISDTFVVYKTTYANLAKTIPAFINSLKDEYILYRLEFFASFRTATEHPLGRFFHEEGYRHWDLIRFKSVIVEFIKNEKIAEAEELIRDYLIGYMIDSMMEHTRKIWLPVMHQGSQSECYDDYKFLNKLMEDSITERLKEYDWDEDE